MRESAYAVHEPLREATSAQAPLARGYLERYIGARIENLLKKVFERNHPTLRCFTRSSIVCTTIASLSPEMTAGRGKSRYKRDLREL